MSVRNMLFAASAGYLSTLDTLDIFGDGSCIALYKFENNVLDMSGNYNGTAVNSPTYSSGKYGNALTLNGSNQYVTTTAPLGTAFSLSLWVNSTFNTGTRILIGQDGGYANFYWDAGASVVRFKTNFDYTIATTNYNYCDGNWHHLVLTFDGTTTKVYFNNVEKTLTLGAAAIKPTTLQYIGRYSAAGYYYGGNVDHLRVFNRALTSGEISTLYTEI